MNNVSIKDSGQGYFSIGRNDVIAVFGFESDIKTEADRLIRLKRNTKNKRIKKKLNKRILKLIGGRT